MGDINAGPPFDLCQVPAGDAPGDALSNFTDPMVLGPTVIGVSVTLGIISLAMVIVRTYTNWRKMHLADWFTIVAMIVDTAYIGVICAQHRNYRHSWDTPACWYSGKTLQMIFVQTTLFAPAFFFPKAAIFLLYRQLFAVNRKPRIAVDAGLVLTLLCYLSNIPMAAIYGAPRIGQTWDSMLLTYFVDSRPLSIGGVVQSAVGTFIDLYIFVLPLPILLRLHMPKKRVLGLVGVFSTAILGVGASIMSLVFKVQVINDPNDGAYLGALASLGSLIEVSIALIVGCMPAVASFSTAVIGDSKVFHTIRTRLSNSQARMAGSRVAGSDPSKQTGSSNGMVEQQDRSDYYYRLATPKNTGGGDYELSRFNCNPRDNGPATDNRWQM